MRVLILCAGNSARSQMAEGLLRHDAGNVYEVSSAGTKPSHVRPEAIAAMREIGIDISGHRSKSVDEFAGQAFDYVITVCDNAKESCPVFPATTKRIHWSLEDPAAVPRLGRGKAGGVPPRARPDQNSPAPVRPGETLTRRRQAPLRVRRPICSESAVVLPPSTILLADGDRICALRGFVRWL